MNSRHIRSLLQLAALLLTAAGASLALAQPRVALTELAGVGGDGPIQVFHPSATEPATVRRGAFAIQVAANGSIAPGNGRLIVVSHGSGAHPMVQADLAIHLARAGYLVALPEHSGDNWHDQSKTGPASWELRPHEVSRAIDAMAADSRFAPLFDAQRVGVFGMSAGGHTALTLAGGRWSRARLLAHCEEHLDADFVACTGAATELRGDLWDGIKKAIARPLIRRDLAGDTAWHGHSDPRIRAAVTAVPFAADFDGSSLAPPAIPLGIVQAEQDRWLVPRFHSMAVVARCPSCDVLASLPNAGHGALLAPLPPATDGLVGRLIADPPGFDRSALPALCQRIDAFFRKHLLA